MKYRVTSGFCLRGGKDVYPGEIIDLSAKEFANIAQADKRLVEATPEDVLAWQTAEKKAAAAAAEKEKARVAAAKAVQIADTEAAAKLKAETEAAAATAKEKAAGGS